MRVVTLLFPSIPEMAEVSPSENRWPATSPQHQQLERFAALLRSSHWMDHPPFELTLSGACEAAFMAGFTDLTLADIERTAHEVVAAAR